MTIVLLAFFNAIFTVTGFSLIALHDETDTLVVIIIAICFFNCTVICLFLKRTEFVEPSCAEFAELLATHSRRERKQFLENVKFAKSLKCIKLYRWDAAITSGFAMQLINENINNIILLLCEYREWIVL